MSIRQSLQRFIRPSRTRSLSALRAKSGVNALLFFAIFMVVLPWIAWRLWPTPVPVPADIRTALGLVLAVGGAAIWITCLESFSRHGGTPLPTDAPRGLVTTGLFAYSRNPIMVGELAIVWAEFAYLGALGVGLYAVLLTAFARWSVVSVEEPELRQRFGEAYEDYCRTVPRWIPGLSSRAAPQKGG